MASSFNTRRAPNVSQYLANLNTIPSPHDLPVDINLNDGDLDFLTNAEFFDFDSFNPAPLELPQVHHDRHIVKSHGAAVNGAQYFTEFQTYPAPLTSSPDSAGLPGQFQPLPSQLFPLGGPNTGDKRKASVSEDIHSPDDIVDSSRFAAEEDKRRRNTAASARFRVKKKQREQAVEKQAKEMTDKVSQLESRVQQLEMENKWLKGLITDKHDGKSFEAMKKEKEAEDRKADEHTTGVGTTDDDEDEDAKTEM